jgi:hypothetical protein
MKKPLMAVYALIFAVISMVLDVTLFWKEVVPTLPARSMNHTDSLSLYSDYSPGGDQSRLELDYVMNYREQRATRTGKSPHLS